MPKTLFKIEITDLKYQLTQNKPTTSQKNIPINKLKRTNGQAMPQQVVNTYKYES